MDIYKRHNLVCLLKIMIKFIDLKCILFQLYLHTLAESVYLIKSPHFPYSKGKSEYFTKYERAPALEIEITQRLCTSDIIFSSQGR